MQVIKCSPASSLTLQFIGNLENGVRKETKTKNGVRFGRCCQFLLKVNIGFSYGLCVFLMVCIGGLLCFYKGCSEAPSVALSLPLFSIKNISSLMHLKSFFGKNYSHIEALVFCIYCWFN